MLHGAAALWGDEEELHTLLGTRNSSSQNIVITLAGSGAVGSADGSGKDANFFFPTDVALLPNLRAIIVTDSRNHKIRVLTIGQTVRRAHAEEPFQNKDENPWLEGVPTVTTLAGAGVGGYKDGLGTEAKFNLPTGIAVHPDGSWVAVADSSNNKIRKVTLASGAVETLAGSFSSAGYQDGTNITAKFRGPSGVAFNPSGDALVIADSSNNRIRWLDLKKMEVRTLAGPRLKEQRCVYGTYLASGGCTGGRCLCGDKMVIGPKEECKHYDYDIFFGTPSVLCQYGSSEKACSNPEAPTIDGCFCTAPNTGDICVTDEQCTLGGICLGYGGYKDGVATDARFNNPSDVSVSLDGATVFVADLNNHVVRRVDVSDGRVSTVAGTPQSAGNEEGLLLTSTPEFPRARFDNPTNVVAYNTDLLLVQDSVNCKVRAVSEDDGFAPSMTGWLTCQDGLYISSGICYQLSKCLCMENETNPVEARRCSDGSSAKDMPDNGKPCTCTPSNNEATCTVSNECTGGGECKTASSGDLDGEASRAKMRQPQGLDIDAAGTFFIVADTRNQKIKMVDCGGPCNNSFIFLNTSASLYDVLLTDEALQLSCSHLYTAYVVALGATMLSFVFNY